MSNICECGDPMCLKGQQSFSESSSILKDPRVEMLAKENFYTYPCALRTWDELGQNCKRSYYLHARRCLRMIDSIKVWRVIDIDSKDATSTSAERG